jgi:hypothetical protein
MRLSFVDSVVIALALAGLASSAGARTVRYSTCLCHYGYGDVRTNAVECDASGGRCSARAVHYSTCLCRYGYGDVCSVAAECDASGGRCQGHCRPK